MPDQDKLAAAAHRWRARLADDDVPQEELNEFHDWLNRDAAHDAAYRRAESAWQTLGQLDIATLRESRPELFRRTLFETFQAQLGGSLQRASLVVATIAAIAVAMLLYNTAQTPTTGKSYRSGKGELLTLTLDDGSQAILGAGSELDVLFEQEQRQVLLKRGDVYVDVVHNPNRPFIVFAGDLAAQALGTAFEVRRGSRLARVAVAEGQVSVVTGSDRSGRTLLTAGQVATARPGAEPSVAELPIEQIAAWRDQRLIYEGAQLKEVVDDLNRYSNTPISLASPAMGDLMITGTFRSDDVAVVLDTLTDVLPLRVDRSRPGELVLFPR